MATFKRAELPSKPKPRSVFATQTFKSSFLAFVNILILAGLDIYYDGGISKERALLYLGHGIAGLACLTGAVQGRMRINEDYLNGSYTPVVTPSFVPGASESDFEVEEY